MDGIKKGDGRYASDDLGESETFSLLPALEYETAPAGLDDPSAISQGSSTCDI